MNAPANAAPSSGTPAGGARQLHALRHAALLGLIAALLVIARWRLAAPAALPEFALYGALHAAALAVSLRVPPAWQRQLLFVAAAALACELLARLGIVALEPAIARWPNAGAPAVLSACGLIGALAYGVLIRAILRYPLPWAALAALAPACAVAIYAAFIAARRWPELGGLWLALFWWSAFSAGLWRTDSRRAHSRRELA